MLKKKDSHKTKKESTHLVLFILGGVVLYFLSGWVDELRVYQGASIAVYVIAISSIILLTGYSGQVSLGHGALMALGAYAAAVLRIEFNLPDRGVDRQFGNCAELYALGDIAKGSIFRDT